MADTLDEIQNEWEKDSKIDITNISKEAGDIGPLHSKYLKILNRHSLLLKKYSNDLYALRKLKWRYYGGKMDATELQSLGWDPFQFILNKDIDVYMDADDNMIKIKNKIAYHQIIVDTCNSILKELNNRIWRLKNITDWERLVQGGR